MEPLFDAEPSKALKEDGISIKLSARQLAGVLCLYAVAIAILWLGQRDVKWTQDDMAEDLTAIKKQISRLSNSGGR